MHARVHADAGRPARAQPFSWNPLASRNVRARGSPLLSDFARSTVFPVVSFLFSLLPFFLFSRFFFSSNFGKPLPRSQSHDTYSQRHCATRRMSMSSDGCVSVIRRHAQVSAPAFSLVFHGDARRRADVTFQTIDAGISPVDWSLERLICIAIHTRLLY